ENVPEFLRAFAHKCIDSGAHAVIGHGPHLLRPVEIYKGLPIFYSLGDFLLQLENCEKVPYDYYIKHGLKPEAGLYEVFKSRTRNFTVGLQRQRVMMESVVASFDITDGKLQDLNFMPLELGLGMPHSQIGLPRCAKDNAIVDRLSEMSEIKF
ncbi:MAG: CapA family protein, partial [Clostridia bacterium]|nr:CapA family protein [Clostridia bacterium]